MSNQVKSISKYGFASDKEKLEEMGAIVTEYNLNDQTVSGMRMRELPVFSVQYHPEAAPGPNDAEYLFKSFHQLVTEQKRKRRGLKNEETNNPD